MKTKKGNKIIIFILIISFAVIIIPLCLLFWPMFIEDYCTKQAYRIIGNRENWCNKTYTANKDEEALVGKNGEICRGFREELKCERNFPFR